MAASTDAGELTSSVPNSVLGKTFTILAAFDGTTESIRIIDVSRRTGIPKPTVYRLVQELVGLGVLERLGTEYRLGRSLFELGQRVPSASMLYAAARPVIVDLCGATRATIHLAVLDGAETYYVERIAGVRGVHHAWARAGSHLPVTQTVSGRLLLAMSPDADELLTNDDDGAAPGPSTTTALRHALDDIRHRRIAVERGEVVVGYKTFAVPITDAGGSTVASLSATVSIDYDAEAHLTTHLRAASAAIGRRLITLNMTHKAFPDAPVRPADLPRGSSATPE